MICPKCGRPLASRRLEGVEVDICQGCRGLWLDQDEMAALAEMSGDFPSPQSRRTEGRPTGFLCPRCGQTLEELRFLPTREVFLDRCRVCHGVWLDPGELPKVAVIAAGLSRPKSKLLRACALLAAERPTGRGG